VPSQSDPPVLLLLVWRFVFPSNKQKELRTGGGIDQRINKVRVDSLGILLETFEATVGCCIAAQAVQRSAGAAGLAGTKPVPPMWGPYA
jgi:hypothetical protein